jgi:predicted ATPase
LLRVDVVAASPPRDLETGDLHELRRRAFAALKELFGRMTDRRPLVIFIDDLQWGDKDSTGLLSYLLSPPDPPKLLLVASYRSEEVGSNQVLQAVLQPDGIRSSEAERWEIAVSALPESESRELALDLLGSRDAEALSRAETIAREAQGSPFFVRELVEYVKAGLSQLGVHLNQMLSHRISLLPEDARQLLAVIAVAGHPVAQGLAATARPKGRCLFYAPSTWYAAGDGTSTIRSRPITTASVKRWWGISSQRSSSRYIRGLLPRWRHRPTPIPRH